MNKETKLYCEAMLFNSSWWTNFNHELYYKYLKAKENERVLRLRNR